MQVVLRCGQVASMVTVVCLALASTALAGVDEQTVSYTFHFFSDVDDVNVFSHYGAYGMDLDSDLQAQFQWNHETVVVPAIDAPSGSQEAVDAITSASRPISDANDAFEDFVKLRDELQGGLTYKGANAGYYTSHETDYFAQMVWGGYNRDLFDANLNLSSGFSYAWDDIKPLDDEDTAGGGGSRRTTHWNLVATHVLSPSTVVRLGGQMNLVRGLQHNPYRNVYAAGTNIAELHPDVRDRQDLFLRVSQYFKNRSSLKLDYKYYSDDWGVNSHTVGVKLSQYVTDDAIVRYRYRYYTQVAADFFRDEYTDPDGVGGFRTGDYRLGDFGAHLFGARVQWNMYRLAKRFDFLRRTHVVLSYERYFNSNNFTANIFETGFDFAF